MPSPVLFLAIPSPDLVINLFASASQALGLAAVGASGLVMRKRQQPGTGSGGGVSSRVALGLGVLWALTAGSFFLYHLKVSDAHDARLRQALVRPSMESGQGVGDVNLRTLGLSAQGHHPAGLETEQFEAQLSAAQPRQIIDVREPEEIERGTIPGALAIPYPDLLAGKHDGELQSDAVLICFSGNRSSELVDELSDVHADLGFIVGGFEKWVAEGRAITGSGERENLRELPAFPGADRLLDTPDVEALVAEHEVVFVDVRYPADYEDGHLPGAINIPLRKLTREQGQAALAALGPVKVIVPCYDKRSSFYASILGLRVSRAGGEFLGRYTVPYEYMVAGAGERAYRAEWKRQQAGQTPYGWLVAGFAGWLQALGGWVGLGWGTVLLALIARALTLPLSWKGSRDHWVEWRSKQDWAAMGAGLAKDPVRRARALGKARKDAGLTPMRNLLGSLLQVVLFLALLSAVGQVSASVGAGEGFLWMDALDQPDPSRSLALACGILAAGLVLEGRWGRKSDLRGRAVLGLSATLVGALLVVLTWELRAAQDLYLVFSLGWVAAQGRVAKILAIGRARQAKALVRTLATCADEEDVGRKAERLGVLTSIGMPVPGGFAITTRGVEALGHASRRKQLESQVRAAFSRLGAEKVAVRSSGLGEDGEHTSFAGIFDTLLDVDKDGLFDAIEKVAASLGSELAQSNGSVDDRGGILVQKMVPAQYSGVLFTEHPQDAGASMLEWTCGVGESLVGGQIIPEAVTFGRLSGDWRKGEQPEDCGLEELVLLGQRIEEHFGVPQDVEWAIVGGKISILQARDVTVRAGAQGSGDAHFERDRQKLVSAVQGEGMDEVILAQDEISELVPNPTPFSARFVADMWLAGGTVDLACRSFGVRFAPSEEGPERVQFALGQVWSHTAVQHRQDGGISSWAGFQLSRALPALELEVQELEQCAKQYATMDRALDLTRFSSRELVDLYERRVQEFTQQSYVTAERVNVAAEWFLGGARQRLEKAGLDAAAYLVPEGTTASRAMGQLADIARGDEQRSAFLTPMGHRAAHDFEWSEARYGEDPRLLDGLLARATPVPVLRPRVKKEAAQKELKGVLAATVDRARRLQVLKEEAKHHALVVLALARRAVAELGRRVGLEGDDVWSLEPADVARLVRESDGEAILPVDLRVKVARAERLRESLEGIDLPSRLTPRDVECLVREGLVFEFPTGHRVGLKGSRVAGSGDVVGRVRVCSDVSELDEFQPGEVLVTRFTDPSWSQVFSTAGGLVTEVGGWLSHAAILAREKNLAAVVGVPDAMRSLKTGMWVRLGGDGRVETLPNQGAAEGDGYSVTSAVSGG